MATKIILAIVLLIGLALIFIFDINQYLTLENLQANQARIQAQFEQQPVLFGAGFFLIYVLLTALSVPGAALMTLVAGSIFGLLWGTVIVSFASSIGATLAFLISRYLLRDLVQERFADKLKDINDGVEKDGGYYLFTLRLVPAFPFFIINIVMGITRIPLGIYYLVSQLGMLPATMVYVNAGKQLATIESLSGILSPRILFAFVLLGLFPVIAKKALDYFKTSPEESS